MNVKIIILILIVQYRGANMNGTSVIMGNRYAWNISHIILGPDMTTRGSQVWSTTSSIT